MSEENHTDASSTSIEPKEPQVPISTMQGEANWDIKWRRNKVMELLSQSKTQREIADELDVHESTISRDLTQLQEEIDDGHKHWVQHVFRENQIALTGLNEVLKDLWRIAREERFAISDRMKAYLLIMNCYGQKLSAVYNKHFVKELKNQYEEWLEKEREVNQTQ